MSDHIFLALFTGIFYGLLRYFAYLTKDRESHQDKGTLNELFVGRLAFWLGGPILLFFIVDIVRIQTASKPMYWLVALFIMGSVLIILIGVEVVYRKFK
ncbi:hypothetical protein [Streptococcus merionis]|uniref:Uncharacterized protein n=1 Tax=Streptococcus merionis TaxID=400065 RepID=A0A239SQ06_9STRE|nr:hypothetical protein [Streptococcus merionis]SNU87487.1 Uncharacterised protein [Streptococcus merionis]